MELNRVYGTNEFYFILCTQLYVKLVALGSDKIVK